MRRPVTLMFFLLAAIILFSSLGGWDLWNPDEPRYAQVAREMMETGQYALPHINARIYPDKPPLFFWMIAAVSIPFGDVNAFSARFPAALFGFGLIVLTYFFARRLFDPLTALLAAVILLTTEGFFRPTLSVHFDAILAFFTTAALFCFYEGYQKNRNQRLFLLGWVFMGLATATKGPVGLAVPLIGMLAFLAVKRDFSTLKSFPFVTGLLMVILINALWLVPACVLGGEPYTRDILVRQTFGRLADSYSHQKPFYYYLYKFPCHTLPWSLFIPGACFYFWKQRRTFGETVFPLLWFMAGFVFFSMVSCKRGLYLLPLYPAFAMLMAKFWRDQVCLEKNGGQVLRREFFMLPSLLVFAVFLLVGCGLALVSFLEAGLPKMAQAPQAILVLAGTALVFCTAAGILLLFSRFRIRSVITAVSVNMFIMAAVTVFTIYPFINEKKSAKGFAERVNSAVKPKDSLAAAFNPELFNYYLHRYPIPHASDEKQIVQIIDNPEKQYLLFTEKQYRKAPEKFRNGISILDRDKIGHRVYCLAVNRTDCEG